MWYNVDTTKYDERAALERFFLFWNEFVAKSELTGFKTYQEGWASGDLGGEHFIGALDLCLIKDALYEVPDELGMQLIREGKAIEEKEQK